MKAAAQILVFFVVWSRCGPRLTADTFTPPVWKPPQDFLQGKDVKTDELMHLNSCCCRFWCQKKISILTFCPIISLRCYFLVMSYVECNDIFYD